MKIKIPFTNKSIILDPFYEGLLFLLAIYAIFALTVILFSAIGPANFFLIVGIFLIVGLFKTTEIEDIGVQDVEKEKDFKS